MSQSVAIFKNLQRMESATNYKNIRALSEASMSLGTLMTLDSLGAALSDGTRRGSSECAKALRALPSIRGQCVDTINNSAQELGKLKN